MLNIKQEAYSTETSINISFTSIHWEHKFAWVEQYNIVESLQGDDFGMLKGEYKIRELPNSLAKNQLKNSLEKMDGVKHVSIQGNVVKVDYDRPANDEDIEDRIRGAGNKLL